MISRRAAIGQTVAAVAATVALRTEIAASAVVPNRAVIEIRSFQYVPERPAVRPGDIVVWKNHDIVPHTVTAKDGSWDSGTIESGGEWKTTVTEAMVRDYYCRHHPSMVASLDIASQR